MERRKFEEQFKDAFNGAEQTPDERVWTNIALELERADSGKMKRRIFFYQMLAAASITFALLTVGIAYYTIRHQTDDSSLASNSNLDSKKSESADFDTRDDNHANGQLNTKQTDDVAKDNSIALNSTEHIAGDRQGHNAGNTEHNAARTNGEKYSTKLSEGRSVIENDRNNDRQNYVDNNNIRQTAALVDEGSQGTDRYETLTFMREKPLSELYTPNVAVKLSFNEDKQAIDPVEKMFRDLRERELELAQEETTKKQNQSDNLWASAGFAAGGYSGGTPQIAQGPVNSFAGNYTSLAQYNNAIANQTSASGVSYSIGMVVGKRIIGRWVVQSGLNYMNNSTSYTSNQVVTEDFKNFKAATLSDLRVSSDKGNNVLNTADHKVNSSLQYVSIPLQAGFVAVDRKFGLQLNAGVATDFFIQNTINPEGSNIQTTQISRGADSPYRSTNFSGLMNTEFSYRIASRYRVSLNPGVRYAFNSIYKKESGIAATPVILDVGLKFRYIFK